MIEGARTGTQRAQGVHTRNLRIERFPSPFLRSWLPDDSLVEARLIRRFLITAARADISDLPPLQFQLTRSVVWASGSQDDVNEIRCTQSSRSKHRSFLRPYRRLPARQTKEARLRQSRYVSSSPTLQQLTFHKNSPSRVSIIITWARPVPDEAIPALPYDHPFPSQREMKR